ncbi:hypothetical protein P3T25_005286 [Paraburkholderia sp. GAS32]
MGKKVSLPLNNIEKAVTAAIVALVVVGIAYLMHM